MNKILALILVGVSVGLGNFAASVAIGLSGVNQRVRAKVALVFGVFETAMPIVGLLIGKQLSGFLGGKANIIGGGLLILTGLYEILSSKFKKEEKKIEELSRNWNKLILSGLALSIDNLIIGFSLGARKDPLIVSAAILGLTSVAMAMLGLEVGNKLSSKVENYAEALSGILLILVGVAVGLKII